MVIATNSQLSAVDKAAMKLQVEILRFFCRKLTQRDIILPGSPTTMKMIQRYFVRMSNHSAIHCKSLERACVGGDSSMSDRIEGDGLIRIFYLLVVR